MNNRERELWIMNNEGLYSWFKFSMQTLAKFIKENKTELDIRIKQLLG